MFVVENCEFTGNKADPPQKLSVSILQTGQIFTGRGGGIGVFIGGVQNVTGVLRNCSFKDNYAGSFGGGAYFYKSGRILYHHVQILDCLYDGNEAGIGGGGAVSGDTHIGERLESFNKVEFLRCNFLSNTGNIKTSFVM